MATKKSPTDAELQARYGYKVDGIERSVEKPLKEVQASVVALAKQVRSFVGDRPESQGAYDALDDVVAQSLVAIQAERAPVAKGKKPAPKTGKALVKLADTFEKTAAQQQQTQTPGQ
jgi:hypothetical protein